MGKRLLASMLWLSSLCVALAQAQPSAYVTFRPEQVEAGDTFQLSVIVSGATAAPQKVDFVGWSDLFPIENILSRTAWKRSGAQWTQRFTLIAFDSLRGALPPLTVLMSSGKPLISNSPTLLVYPTRGATELSDMAPIRDIYSEPESWIDYWPWGLGFLAALLLLFYLLRRAGKRKLPPPVQAPPPAAPPPSALETALAQLRALQQQGLWKKGAVQEHYAALSLILREFLENKYGVAALESTTLEIMQLLRPPAIDQARLRQLKDLLEQYDLVKYAGENPPENTHEKMIDQTREWME